MTCDLGKTKRPQESANKPRAFKLLRTKSHAHEVSIDYTKHTETYNGQTNEKLHRIRVSR